MSDSVNLASEDEFIIEEKTIGITDGEDEIRNMEDIEQELFKEAESNIVENKQEIKIPDRNKEAETGENDAIGNETNREEQQKENEEAGESDKAGSETSHEGQQKENVQEKAGEVGDKAGSETDHEGQKKENVQEEEDGESDKAGSETSHEGKKKENLKDEEDGESDKAGNETDREEQQKENKKDMEYEEYIVNNGDTLVGICKKKYNSLLKMKEICKINNIKNADYIAPGQKLYLPR